MSEFQEVMKQWKRKCEHCTDDDTVCNINSIVCAAFCEMKNFNKFALVEKDVMSWAAEHSELVYPTWEEWLITQGVIKENPNGIGWPMPKLFERIPADMAQKLGIEPKEETCHE